jgi:hypothetical protein
MKGLANALRVISNTNENTLVSFNHESTVMKKTIQLFAAIALISNAFAGTKSETRYNGDEYCGSYENPCICDNVDPLTGHCRNSGGG